MLSLKVTKVTLVSPVFSFFGIPPETAPLVLIRPISGSAALAVGAELMQTYGVDTTIGRTVAVMLGSTETTFYTITVYFAALKKKAYPCVFLSSIIADLAGFVFSALIVKIFFGL